MYLEHRFLCVLLCVPTMLSDTLRGHVVERPHLCVGNDTGLILLDGFGNSKVNQLKVSMAKEEIGGLKI